MMWHEVIFLSTILVSTEQKPSIYFESETDLLEEIRGIRNTDNGDILFSSKIQRFFETDLDETVPPLVQNEEIQTTQINEDEEENGRKIRDIQASTQKQEIVTISSNIRQENKTENETTISSEETTPNEETTVEPCDKVDFLAIFLKLATKNYEDDTDKQRRSVKEIDLEEIEAEDVEEDLDTAANTVFRPLFAYRQQEARRRRYRTLNN